MHVFSTNADWINTFMMFFVDKAVDAWMMQNAMGPIENEIIINDAEQNLPNYFNSFQKNIKVKKKI